MDPSGRLSDEARGELQKALLDEVHAASRHQYVSTILALLTNVEDWIAIDSWLGGGQVVDPGNPEAPSPESFASFRAISAVVSMSTELTEAAVCMAQNRRYYAVGAVLRQLIECEYLLSLFNEDLDHASRWLGSTPEQIRASFTPAKMRKLTGFSNEEYWRHCSAGGHPAPKGIPLLEKMDPLRNSWPYAAAELQIDLGLHLNRIWGSVDSLLAKHHARYAAVRADKRREATEAWTSWQAADPVVSVLAAAWKPAEG